MKYIIQGQNINKIYKVVRNKNEDGSFTSKPEMKLDSKNITYSNITEFETDSFSYNSENCMMLFSFGSANKLNISEEEEVCITKEVFRADIVTKFLISDKILSETDNKDDLLKEYNALMSEYCHYICEKYPNVKRHIEIYNISLPIEEIDDIVAEVECKNKPCAVKTINLRSSDFPYTTGDLIDWSNMNLSVEL